MSRVLRVVLPVLLTIAIGSRTLAGCLPADWTPMDEAAGCAHGDHDCGPAMKAADCCESGASAQVFIATKPVPAAKSLAAITASAAHVALPPVAPAGIAHAALTVSSSSPPTFLLVPLRI